ncbi:MAG: IS1595 family transposase [Acidiferrobacterales bacterium]|nr:IS1595 family transposase [Acidiferrobacterales bacterium]
MASKAPGKHFRKGISLPDLFRIFPDDDAAQAWLEQQRWGGEPWCPHCGSFNVRSNRHKSMPWRCCERECRKRFSVRVGTPLYKSPLGYQTWVVAIYLLTTSLKSVSSMKLHRDLNITQKTAWFLAYRIREAFSDKDETLFSGPVEADEAYFGGKRHNMSNTKRKELKETSAGRGSISKTPVVSVKDRATNEIRAQVVDSTDAETLQGFVLSNTSIEATVYTDDAAAYDALPRHHESVKHSVSEYVRDQAHVNGVESFWSTLKRAHKGTFHKLSPKHLDRYVQEFAGRHNIRCQDTLIQMGHIVREMDGKYLPYAGLKKDTGLSSEARA